MREISKIGCLRDNWHDNTAGQQSLEFPHARKLHAMHSHEHIWFPHRGKPRETDRREWERESCELGRVCRGDEPSAQSVFVVQVHRVCATCSASTCVCCGDTWRCCCAVVQLPHYGNTIDNIMVVSIGVCKQSGKQATSGTDDLLISYLVSGD